MLLQNRHAIKREKKGKEKIWTTTLKVKREKERKKMVCTYNFFLGRGYGKLLVPVGHFYNFDFAFSWASGRNKSTSGCALFLAQVSRYVSINVCVSKYSAHFKLLSSTFFLFFFFLFWTYRTPIFCRNGDFLQSLSTTFLTTRSVCYCYTTK